MTNTAAASGRFGSAFDWLEVERAWQRTRGSPGVLIGIVDRGVQLDHPLLGPNIQRDHSHHPAAAGEHDIPGTHAAGVAAGRSSDVERFSGVAPDARILPVRYSSGPGPQALDLAHAIEYAVERGAHVVHIGDASGLEGHAMRRAVKYAATRNVLVVHSAPSLPADATETPPNLISILSLDERFEPIGAADRGDLAAPGFARVPRWRGSGHSTLQSATIGAAYVSGCAALLKSLHPGWGYHELREHLLVSGTSRPELANRCHEGKLLNVGEAVLGPIELISETRALQWSSLGDATLTWKLRYRSAYCVNAVALYRPHGDAHWRELACARAAALQMTVPAASLRRSSGMLKIASREANFHSEEIELTIR